MRSRVMPGSSVTIERRCPTRRLNSVDLPTFGRPTITTDGLACVMRSLALCEAIHSNPERASSVGDCWALCSRHCSPPEALFFLDIAGLARGDPPSFFASIDSTQDGASFRASNDSARLGARIVFTVMDRVPQMSFQQGAEKSSAMSFRGVRQNACGLGMTG